MHCSAPLMLSGLIRIIFRALLAHLPLIPNHITYNPKKHENINTKLPNLIILRSSKQTSLRPYINYYFPEESNLLAWTMNWRLIPYWRWRQPRWNEEWRTGVSRPVHATNIATLPARNYMPPSYKPQPRSRFEILKMDAICSTSIKLFRLISNSLEWMNRRFKG